MYDEKDFRFYASLFEAKENNSTKIEYYNSSGKITESIEECSKTIAILRSKESAKFTKMVRDLQESKKDLENIQKQVSDQENVLREEVAKYFDESLLGVATMVIKTCKNIITLAKGGEKKTVSYAKALKEFEKELTPELREILDKTLEKHTKVSNSKQSLTLRSIDENSSINENFAQNIINGVKRFAASINFWKKSYSNKMNSIMSQIDN